MPVCVESVSLDKYLLWLSSQLSDSESELNSPPLFILSIIPSLIFLKSNQNNTDYDFSFIPIKIYSNADTQKEKLLKESKNKLGVYRWINKVNGKSNIGSSINLHNRFKNHY